MKRKLSLTTVFILTGFLCLYGIIAFLIPGKVSATTCTWVGGTDSNWETIANWSGCDGSLPGDDDDVLINSNVTVNINSSTTVNSLTLGDGTTTPTLNFNYNAIESGDLILDEGNLVINTNAQITHTSASGTTIVGTVSITLQTGSVTIDGKINVNTKGYAGGTCTTCAGIGPGAGGGGSIGNGGGGASYGGLGSKGNGTSAGVRYGNLSTYQLGSGGGGGYSDVTGGTGGGAVKLTINNTLTVNGSIESNGGTTNTGWGGGGGSGGFIYITAANLAGSGAITANGGNPYSSSGAGGGGRIYISYSGTNSYGNGNVATGGTGAENGTNLLYDSTNAHLYIAKSQTWSAKSTTEGPTHSYTNITVQSPAIWSLKGYYTTDSDGVGITFDTTNFTIDSGAKVVGTGGYSGGYGTSAAGTGPGKGRGGGLGSKGDGAGHGGLGNYNDSTYGNTYGSETVPMALGSGGGGGYNNGQGGNGGGAVAINASSTVTINGEISVNGTEGTTTSSWPGGGGSGGSIYINTTTFQGSGVLTATGGNSTNGNSGAGGRVAIIYIDGSWTGTSLIAPAAAAHGTGSTNSADGTVYVSQVPLGYITGLPANLNAYKSSDGTTDLENPDNAVRGIQEILYTDTNNTSVAKGSIYFSGDRNLSNVSADTDTTANKAFFRVSGGYSSIAGYVPSYPTYTLYIPKGGSDNLIYMCPDATSLEGITASCSNVYTLNASSPNVSTTTIDSQSYWLVGSLTQGGGLSYSPNSAPNTPTISGQNNIYAGQTYNITTTYSDTDGAQNLDKMYIQIQNPAGTNIEYYASESEDATGLTPVAVSGSDYIRSITYDINTASPDTNSIEIVWHITTDWDWTESTTIKYGVRAVDDSAADSGWTYTENNYLYENDLTFYGSLVVTSASKGVLNSGDWVKSSDIITWTGVRVVFEGTTNVCPSDDDYDVILTDDDTGLWSNNILYCGNILIESTTDNATDTSDTHTISIIGIPTGASAVSNITFEIKVDASIPDIVDVTGNYENTWQAVDAGPVISWTDPNSPSGDTFLITIDGSDPLLTNYEYSTDQPTYDLPNMPAGVTTIKVRPWNSTSSYGATKSFILKYDPSTPDIVDITGNYENTWQDQDPGPVISWTDPNSTSDDLFLITTDGTEPTASNYDYSTTWPTYDLPDMPQGETTISVRPQTNAGTYGTTHTFIIKYESSTPDIVDITGNHENTWQNQDAGPIISWTNPNSPSGDVFYITVDDSEPTSSNYAYTTTSITYDLPNMPAGTTTIKVRPLNNAGNYGLTRTFIIKFDNVIPDIVDVTGNSEDTWQDEDSGPIISWTDPASLSDDVFLITNNGADPLISSYTYMTTSPTYDLPDQIQGTTTIKVRPWNNAGNYGETRTFIIKYESSAPDIVDITGSYEDVWQNQNSGPVISWTDPNSPSGDTFYITINGSEPASDNYVYITTDPTYDLPAMPNGTTTIKVRALSNAGNYGLTRSFILKFDNSTPDIEDVQGNYEDIWQNQDAGPVIWWNDPHSPSDDIFYITTNGIDPLTTSYQFTTNNPVYNLPDLSAGTTTVKVRPWNTAGNYGLTRTFIVKYDDSIPDIIDITGDYENTWQSENPGPVISWTDPNSLSDDKFLITTDNNDPELSDYTYLTTNPNYDLPDLATGITTIKVRACNNLDVCGSTRSFVVKYDPTVPDIIDITGANENTWQNEDPGPLISWTNPLSPSGDTFYITTNNTDPDSSNYAYITTAASYNLPGQGNGITTVKVRAKNGAGTYSSIQSFVIKYDSVGPVNVSNLSIQSISTSTLKLTWGNPTSSDFQKVKILRKQTGVPANINDGTLVYEGSLESLTDSGLKANTRYYYTVFSLDTLGNASSGASDSALTKAESTTPPDDGDDTEEPTNPEEPVILEPNPEEPAEPEEPDTGTAPETEEPDNDAVTSEYIKKLVNLVKNSVKIEIPEEKPLAIFKVDKQEIKATSKSKLHFYKNEDIYMFVPIENLKDGNKRIKQVMILIANHAYIATYNKNTKNYETSYEMPEVNGEYVVNVIVTYQNNETKILNINYEIDPFGYVYDQKGEWTKRIKGAKVSLYVKVSEDDIKLWDTDIENFPNPQITKENGEYKYFVEPGTYKLKVSAEGYKPYESEWFEVKERLIEKNIKLEKEADYRYLLIAIASLLTFSICLYSFKHLKKHR